MGFISDYRCRYQKISFNLLLGLRLYRKVLWQLYSDMERSQTVNSPELEAIKIAKQSFISSFFSSFKS